MKHLVGIGLLASLAALTAGLLYALHPEAVPWTFLVGYVLLDLEKRGKDVRCFVHALEGWVIDTLAEYAPNIKSLVLHRQVLTPLDIERTVALGGPLHSKGVLILSGYLGAQYSQDLPLSLTASGSGGLVATLDGRIEDALGFLPGSPATVPKACPPVTESGSSGCARRPARPCARTPTRPPGASRRRRPPCSRVSAGCGSRKRRAPGRRAACRWHRGSSGGCAPRSPRSRRSPASPRSPSGRSSPSVSRAAS